MTHDEDLPIWQDRLDSLTQTESILQKELLLASEGKRVLEIRLMTIRVTKAFIESNIKSLEVNTGERPQDE